MMRLIVDGVEYKVSWAGPRVWSQEGADWAQAVTTALSTLSDTVDGLGLVDASTRVAKAGDTMTGQLVIDADTSGGVLFLKGTNDAASIKFQRQETVLGEVNPTFMLGNIEAGGVNLPMISFMYRENDTGTWKHCFIVESSGTCASVSDGDRRSHYEAFLKNGDVDPVMRLNSSPYMTLELGPGGVTSSAGGFVRSANVTTVTTDAAHGLAVGSYFNYSNPTTADPNFPAVTDGSAVVATAPTATTFTFADPGADATSVVDFRVSGPSDVHFKRSGAFTAQLALGGTARMTWYPGAVVCEANVDFYVNNGSNPLIWASAGYNRVSMGAPVPGAKLHVQGTATGELVTIFQSPASHTNHITEWWNSSGSAVSAMSKDGKLVFQATDSSGTPGNATINKPSGQVSVASGASSVTVTNSLVSATSIVTAVLQDNTDAVEVRSVVPGSGTFTINLTGVTSGDRKVGFVVFN